MADPEKIDFRNHRYPFCIVWTPIPLLTWLFPFIGHMGMATSSGVIRDFAGPYYVSEDEMAFGNPTKYWQLQPQFVEGGAFAWDQAVSEASEIYSHRMHNLFCDNCHSHVARALNIMNYQDQSWNMVKLCFYMLFKSSSVGCQGWLKTYVMPIIIWGIIITAILSVKYI